MLVIEPVFTINVMAKENDSSSVQDIGNKMETLHTKGIFVLELSITAAVGVVMVFFLGIKEWKFGLPIVIALTLWIIFACTKIYLKNWIKYGEGKVIIQRVSKDLDYSNSIYGRPTGKWKSKRDEILLEEIEAYGYSWALLGMGRTVECHNRFRQYQIEYCFLLKDGRKVGFNMVYYGKGTEALFRYIYDGTGIEVTPFRRM